MTARVIENGNVSDPFPVTNGQTKRYKDSLNNSVRTCDIHVKGWEHLAADRSAWRLATHNGAQAFEERRLSPLDIKERKANPARHQTPSQKRAEGQARKERKAKPGKRGRPSQERAEGQARKEPEANTAAAVVYPVCGRICAWEFGLRSHQRRHWRRRRFETDNYDDDGVLTA